MISIGAIACGGLAYGGPYVWSLMRRMIVLQISAF